MVNKLVFIATKWAFFSVVLGLVHLWVAWVITFWSDKPALQNTLTDGSLLVFSIALVATSYGVNYERLGRNYSDWLSLFALIAFVILLGSALVVYALIVYPQFLELDIRNPPWVSDISIYFVIAAALYGLSCHIFIEII